MDAQYAALPVERLTQPELDALLEYSLSLPTGTTIGKRWKRRIPARGPLQGWAIGKYVTSDQPNEVGIEWSRVEIAESVTAGHAPRGEP